MAVLGNLRSIGMSLDVADNITLAVFEGLRAQGSVFPSPRE